MARGLSQAPLYNRQLDGSVDLPQVRAATGGADFFEQLSHSAGMLGAKLNDVSEKLYTTNFESLARKTISQISEANKNDPQRLTQDFEKAFEGLTKDVSPLLHDEIKARYEVLTRPYIAQATETKTRINNDLLKENSLTVLSQSMNDLEHNAQSMLSKNESVSYEASRAAQLQLLTIDKMLAQTDADGEPLFSADYRVKVRDQSTQGLMQLGLTRWFDEQPNKAAAAKAIVNGEKKFKFYDQDGNVMRELDPTKDMDAGAFDKLRNHMDRELEAQRKKAKDAELINSIQSFINGDQLIDPKNKKSKAAIDGHFQEVITPQLSALNDVEKANVIAGYVEKVGLLPTSLQGQLRAITRNGAPQQQAFAADLIGRVQEKAPMALDDMPEKDLSYGLMMAQSLRYGMTPEEAIARLEKQFDPLHKEVIYRREREYKTFDDTAEADVVEALKESRFWGIGNLTKLSDVADVSDQTLSDYNAILRQEYLTTGDIDVAKKSAIQIFKRTYGVTKITGEPRVVKYPPEKYYAVPGLSDEWMGEQAADEVRKIERYKDVKKEDVAIVPDSITARQATPDGKPSYLVFVKDANGSFNPVRDEDGDLNRFVFDSTQAIDKVNAKTSQRRKEKLNDAKLIRNIDPLAANLAAAMREIQ